MEINRVWAMPNKSTFTIKPIHELIERCIDKTLNDNRTVRMIDPFCYRSPFAEICITNDIDKDVEASYHMDAIDFLKTFDDKSVDLVLYDPPYSSRQVSECYKKAGIKVNMETTQGSYWSKLKVEIERICNPGACVVACGWNSNGIGKKYGFTMNEILLVPHGGAHYDTIVTVETRNS